MDSSDSNSDDLEIRHSDEPRPSSSPLTRMRDDDVEAMLRKRKQSNTTTTALVPSPVSKMNWTKNDELVILGGIVDYENEMELSYRPDWDALYRYIKDSIETNFSKKQLINKVKNLKKRFIYNQARFNDGKGFSFTNTDDDEIFKLSMLIWAKNKTEFVSNENLDQAKDVPCADQENEDVPFAEQKRVSIEIDNGEKEKSEEDGVDELCVMEETLESRTTFFQSLGEKEKSEEDGVDELCVLQEALEAQTLFQKFQEKFLLQNLENLGAQRRKELIDEWKALLIEELQFNIKKQTFSAKLANGGVSP